jgi:microcystin-dependent protein
MYAGAVVPGGWLLCDGTAYPISNPIYSALFTVISTAYGGTPGSTFCVPDLRTRTVFGASVSGFQGDTQPWVPTMGAVSFSQLQAEFSGTTVPNGTAANGRGALAVKSIPVGYELQVGMRCQALAPEIDQGVHVIVAILNYNGGGGSYTNPNFPVLIINPPLTADSSPNAQWTVTPVAPYPYYLSRSLNDNFYTQITTDVPAHTHPVPEGGVLGNIGIDSNVPIGQPNVASPFTTGNPTTNFYYSVGSSTLGQPATVFTIGTSMNTRPSMVAMNYIIKF